MSEKTTARVDEAGHVYVVEADGERLIGQYADVSPEEALAFFERKFNDTNSALYFLNSALSAVLLPQKFLRAQRRLQSKSKLATVSVTTQPLMSVSKSSLVL